MLLLIVPPSVKIKKKTLLTQSGPTRGFIDQLSDYQFHQKESALWNKF